MRLLVVLMTALLLAGCGEPAGTRQPIPEATVTAAEPALLAVHDGDGALVAYLFGTIHLLPPEMTWQSDAVDAALEASGLVMLETDTATDPAETQALLARLGTLPPGTSLRAMLPDPLRAKWETALVQVGLAPEQLDGFKPWLASLVLALQVYQQMGFDPEAGVDETIAAWARANDRSLAYFETNAEQFGFFDGLSDETELALMRVTLEDMAVLPQMIQGMLDTWAGGDLEGLYAVMSLHMGETPEVETVLLSGRNARWAERLSAEMGDGRVRFVAVGAGHLGGPDSLQTLLCARGYRVERVAPGAPVTVCLP